MWSIGKGRQFGDGDRPSLVFKHGTIQGMNEIIGGLIRPFFLLVCTTIRPHRNRRIVSVLCRRHQGRVNWDNDTTESI